MLLSRCKEETSPEDFSEMVLMGNQDEILKSDNEDMIKPFTDKDNFMHMPLTEPYGPLYEPKRSVCVPPTGTLPALDDWPGEYNFELILSSNPGRSILYSTKLRKLFANIDTQIPIEFRKVTTREEFMIRALPVYTSSQDCRVSVKRCISHMMNLDSNQGISHVEHVVRCKHRSAQYHSDSQSGRLSVVVPMEVPQAGVDKVKVLYEFVCKSSCIGGMNRRPIALVFTLERLSGEVVGRQHLDVRICSCPRRDKMKEENYAGMLNKATQAKDVGAIPEVMQEVDEDRGAVCARSRHTCVYHQVSPCPAMQADPLQGTTCTEWVTPILHSHLTEPYGPLYERKHSVCVPPTGTLPALDDWPGEYNFELILSSNSGRSIVYSAKLHKLFADMDTEIPIEFGKVTTREEFMIRALPVYTSSQDCQVPVKRCISHMMNLDSNQGISHVEHVVRCKHQSAQYHSDSQSGRFSVVVPMEVPQAGVDKVKVLYEFVCKNSCIGGMNRRPIAVVFTLERLSGEVVGRCRLDVRICSSPKRDKQKEEKFAVMLMETETPAQTSELEATSEAASFRLGEVHVAGAVGHQRTRRRFCRYSSGVRSRRVRVGHRVPPQPPIHRSGSPQQTTEPDGSIVIVPKLHNHLTGPYGPLHEPKLPVCGPPTGTLPALDDWPGEYNLELFLSSTLGPSIVYSTKLSKLFANVDTQIPIEFRKVSTSEKFMIRALPVYTACQDYELPVRRCISHRMNLDSGQGIAYVDHVVRCKHQSAQYHSDSQSGRFSVVVPMEVPQAGVDKVKVLYEFVCNSSCIGGMNRRPIAVVFTLERLSGEVVGRRRLDVRICSCPKRDKKKEEDSAEVLSKAELPAQVQDAVATSEAQSPRMQKLVEHGTPDPQGTRQTFCLGSVCATSRQISVGCQVPPWPTNQDSGMPQQTIHPNGAVVSVQSLPDNLIEKCELLYEPKHPMFIPPTGALPALDDWAGEYNFELIFSSNPGRSILYSTKLRKLFANVDTQIPIEFRKVTTREEFMIRALPVYTSSQDCQVPVKRCISHMMNLDSDEGIAYVDHVVRCKHQSAQYHSDSQSGRLSVIVPMEVPQAGVDKVKVLYEFVCKSSCIGGMNRRPIAVVFTLERLSGEVVGRRRLDVRICSCPKRDKKKEEQSAGMLSKAGALTQAKDIQVTLKDETNFAL